MAEKTKLEIVLETGTLKTFRDLFKWNLKYNMVMFARESGMKYSRLRVICRHPNKITDRELQLVADTLQVNVRLIIPLVTATK